MKKAGGTVSKIGKINRELYVHTMSHTYPNINSKDRNLIYLPILQKVTSKARLEVSKEQLMGRRGCSFPRDELCVQGFWRHQSPEQCVNKVWHWEGTEHSSTRLWLPYPRESRASDDTLLRWAMFGNIRVVSAGEDTFWETATPGRSWSFPESRASDVSLTHPFLHLFWWIIFSLIDGGGG